MIKALLHRQLNTEERRLGASMDYLRQILDNSLSAFMRFCATLPLTNSRKTLPKDAWHLAQLVSVRKEDCGTCVQIHVNLALSDGLAAEFVQAVLDGDLNGLTSEQREIHDFTQAIVNGGLDPDELRQSIRQRYGEKALIELAYAIASSRTPPTLKKVLGHARTCQQVTIETTVSEQPGG